MVSVTPALGLFRVHLEIQLRSQWTSSQLTTCAQGERGVLFLNPRWLTGFRSTWGLDIREGSQTGVLLEGGMGVGGGKPSLPCLPPSSTLYQQLHDGKNPSPLKQDKSRWGHERALRTRTPGASDTSEPTEEEHQEGAELQTNKPEPRAKPFSLWGKSQRPLVLFP